MGVTALKAERIVDVGLQLLVRELTLPATVWRDAAGDFAGAKDDTISIRVPTYTSARTRALRSGSSRTRDNLEETKVDVTLSTDVYKDVRITDEQLTLDIRDFGAQVLNPIVDSIARKLEDGLVTEMTNADYEFEIEWDDSDPYASLVAARRKLNDARVPKSGRTVAVGSALEASILLSDRFTKFDNIGAEAATAIREATLGRMAGFDVLASPALDPDEAVAYHKSAFVMSSRAPIVPAGAPYGASASAQGFAVRVVRVLDPDTIEDILATDSWVGYNTVEDHGSLSSGIFTPSTDPDTDSGSDLLFVRAVHLVNESS